MANRSKVTPARKEKFLQRLSWDANVTASAKAIDVSRRRMYEERDHDPEFAVAWDEAVEAAVDRLEQEAWRRATEGVEKPITFQGKITGHFNEYSDRLLEFLLKGRRADTFKDRAEVTGKDGDPLGQLVVVLPAKDGEHDAGEGGGGQGHE